MNSWNKIKMNLLWTILLRLLICWWILFLKEKLGGKKIFEDKFLYYMVRISLCFTSTLILSRWERVTTILDNQWIIFFWPTFLKIYTKYFLHKNLNLLIYIYLIIAQASKFDWSCYRWILFYFGNSSF